MIRRESKPQPAALKVLIEKIFRCLDREPEAGEDSFPLIHWVLADRFGFIR